MQPRVGHRLEALLDRGRDGRGTGEPDSHSRKVCIAYGYVDDGRYAASRAEALAARGQGDAAIRFDLRGRGLDTDAVDAALATLPPEAERAAELADRLGRTPKTAARLRRKGFSGEAVEQAFSDGFAAGAS